MNPPHQASELRTHNGSLPVDAISRPYPQLLSNRTLWPGKYPGTFESITHHFHRITKYPGTLLFIPRCPTVHSPSVPQIGHQRLLEGSQHKCQKTHLSTNKNGLKVYVRSEMASQYKS